MPGIRCRRVVVAIDPGSSDRAAGDAAGAARGPDEGLNPPEPPPRGEVDAVSDTHIALAPMQEQSPRELVFEVTQEADGGYTAECLGHDIFTQGASWSELRYNAREAVEAYCFDRPLPESVRGYCAVHQRGSHIVLETSDPSRHRVVVPDHHELRIGTLNSVLRAVAAHKGIDRGEILEQ